jgi:carbon-monoxide dehydrogenase medium subunit
MKPPPFRYHDPRTIGDVVQLLGRLENAKLLAGGQSPDAHAEHAVRAATTM